MTLPAISREAWLAARLDLLADEKDLTRRSDDVARKRQALPRVRIDKAYTLDTDRGPLSLRDLFGGRSQLIVYHFMYGPDYKAGCASCSAIADGYDRIVPHLENHDVAFWTVSRAPLPVLQAYKARMGWSFPWASSSGSDFNSDFNVWFSEMAQREGGIVYNYAGEPPMALPPAGNTLQGWKNGQGEGPVAENAAMTGTDILTYTRDRPGMSTFVLEDGVVYHTYSAYARGVDGLWNMYQWLDRAPKGRNESGVWWRRRDEYGRS